MQAMVEVSDKSVHTLLPLMEDFYTIQGEGFYQGQAAYFIRLGGCDVGCVWCDVKESWDASLHPFISVAEITERTMASGTPVAVITGGEPLMYDLTQLTTSLQQSGIRTHLETSGAYPLTGDWDWICFSPKKFKAPDPDVPPRADELKSDAGWPPLAILAAEALALGTVMLVLVRFAPGLFGAHGRWIFSTIGGVFKRERPSKTPQSG